MSDLRFNTGAPERPVTASTDFSESFDARDWAKAFVEHVTANPAIAADEGTMLAWFANALMRGYDERENRLREAAASSDASPRAGGETPMIDPKRIAADAVQRLADSEPDEDAIAAMDRLAGTPQESMFCVSAPVLEGVIEVTIADALFAVSRASLLEVTSNG